MLKKSVKIDFQRKIIAKKLTIPKVKGIWYGQGKLSILLEAAIVDIDQTDICNIVKKKLIIE